jgi:hypothetical protein
LVLSCYRRDNLCYIWRMVTREKCDTFATKIRKNKNNLTYDEEITIYHFGDSGTHIGCEQRQCTK